MRACLIIVSLFIFAGPLFPFSLQKNIPVHTLYGGVKIQENMSGLLYRLLSPNLKNQFYPGGPNVSSIKTAIHGLKNLGVQDVEFFINDEWPLLLKINTTKLQAIQNLFIKILNQEGFMAQAKVLNATDRLIYSKNTELVGNNFYIHREGKYILITPNAQALNTWKTRRNSVKLYKEGVSKLKDTPDAIGFIYDEDHHYFSDNPSFMTISTEDNLASLKISNIQPNPIPKLTIPFFFKDNPLFLIMSSASLDTPQKKDRLMNSLIPLMTFLPTYKLPLDILLSPSSGVKSFALEFVDGDLVSVNDKKFDALDFSLCFGFDKSETAKNFLFSHLKNNPIFEFSSRSSKDLERFVLTPKIPNAKDLGLFPVYFILDDTGNLVLSLNKKTIDKLAQNIGSHKNTLIFKGDDATPRIIYVNVAEIIDRFPILNSLVSQTGLDLKSIKEFEELANYKQYNEKTFESEMQLIFTTP